MAIDLKKALQLVSKEIKALSKKVDKLVTIAGKAEKAKPKATKAKPVKKAAPKAKKAVPKTKKAVPKAKKKAVAKKPVAKKVIKVTAADTVLKIINRTKKGIDTAGLMKKTEFDNKKVANIIFKLKKQGKIISPIKGVYLKAQSG